MTYGRLWHVCTISQRPIFGELKVPRFGKLMLLQGLRVLRGENSTTKWMNSSGEYKLDIFCKNFQVLRRWFLERWGREWPRIMWIARILIVLYLNAECC